MFVVVVLIVCFPTLHDYSHNVCKTTLKLPTCLKYVQPHNISVKVLIDVLRYTINTCIKNIIATHVSWWEEEGFFIQSTVETRPMLKNSEMYTSVYNIKI